MSLPASDCRDPVLDLDVVFGRVPVAEAGGGGVVVDGARAAVLDRVVILGTGRVPLPID